MNRASLPRRATSRTRPSALDAPAPALSPGCVLLSAFPLGSLPFLPHLLGRGLVRWVRRYYGAIRLPTLVHLRRTTLCSLSDPARDQQPGQGGISRFSRMEVPYMPWIFDHAGSTNGSRKRRQRCCLPPLVQRGHPDRIISRLNSPACTYPLSTLRHALAGRRRMTRGRRGSLALRRRAPASLPPYRFIPAAFTR